MTELRGPRFNLLLPRPGQKAASAWRTPGPLLLDASASLRRPVIGVMGAGESASETDCSIAERLGELVAEQGWILLTGGRDAGVMAAANRGAKRVAGSFTVGILPSEGGAASPHVDLAIFTGLGQARNAINALSSQVLIACGAGGAGTASEIALAIKSGKPVILVTVPAEAAAFFRTLGERVFEARSAEDALALIRHEELVAS